MSTNPKEEKKYDDLSVGLLLLLFHFLKPISVVCVSSILVLAGHIFISPLPTFWLWILIPIITIAAILTVLGWGSLIIMARISERAELEEHTQI